ncbi:MAG: hypothetical protein SH848_01660 [Saprospiraceae bacterium]|nr:hypothetical protein [Saprospiraceae bacterium]
MQEIIALAEFVSKNKIKKIEQVALKGKTRTHLKVLYEQLASGKGGTEEEISTSFYGDNPHKSMYFSRLKRQLRDRLVNTIFLIDANLPAFNEYQKAYYSCYKDMVASKILLGRHARPAAIPLAQETLKKALSFGFTDIILGIAKDLQVHYGGLIGDKKKYTAYKKIVTEYTNIYFAELKAEEYYLAITFNYAKSTGSKVELADLAQQYYQELAELIQHTQSYRLCYLFYQVSLLRFEITNDYENSLKVCEEALDFFQSDQRYMVHSQSVKVSFMNKSLACHLRLQQYTEGEALSKKALQSVPEGSINWFNTLSYYITICFHSQQYQKAYQIYEQATGHPKFKHLIQNKSEIWNIFQAYVHYFIMLGKIKPDLSQSSTSKFRASKFLNQVPTFSRDKQGANISILILHTLFLLAQGDYNKIIDRVESLNMYTHRYLRKDDTFRSNCFIKMLVQLPHGNFVYKPVMRKVHRYWEALRSMPLVTARQNAELEVVPYETLWEYVLQALKGAPPRE